LHEELLVRHHTAFQTSEQSTAAASTAVATDEENANANPDTNQMVCDLESLHQAVLSRIRQRHNALCDRADAWENYKLSLAKLLSWLDTTEKERNRLELRQIQEHGIQFCLLFHLFIYSWPFNLSNLLISLLAHRII